MRHANGRNRVLLGIVFAGAVGTGYFGGQLAAQEYCDDLICNEYTEYGFIEDGRLWCAKLVSFDAFENWYCRDCMGGLRWASPYKHNDEWCDPICHLFCRDQTNFNQQAAFCYGCEILFEDLETYYCDVGHH